MISSIFSSEVAKISSWGLSNISINDTLPLDSPYSHRLMGSISIREIRPVPLWWILLSSIALDPVNMNWPGKPRSSTFVRTASHSIGASCHSSIKRGTSPSNKNEGLVMAVAKYSSRWSVSCKLITLLANCLAVVVLPHHFGPSMSTAPIALRCALSRKSKTLFRYAIFDFVLCCKGTHFNLITKRILSFWCASF